MIRSIVKDITSQIRTVAIERKMSQSWKEIWLERYRRKHKKKENS